MKIKTIFNDMDDFDSLLIHMCCPCVEHILSFIQLYGGKNASIVFIPTGTDDAAIVKESEDFIVPTKKGHQSKFSILTYNILDYKK